LRFIQTDPYYKSIGFLPALPNPTGTPFVLPGKEGKENIHNTRPMTELIPRRRKITRYFANVRYSAVLPRDLRVLSRKLSHETVPEKRSTDEPWLSLRRR